MLYRTLGSTGVSVSILGFGCMRLPTAGAPDRIDEPAATRLLHAAIDAGVNYVDTAWFYHGTSFGQQGQSEPFVGRALSGGWRDRVNLATKLPQQIIRSADQMEGFLTRQLERLQTDHIDFYLVHGLDGDAWKKMKGFGVREFLDEEKRRGRIRFPGFSFHGSKDDFPRIVDDYDGWTFAQIQYNYMDTDYQAGAAGLRYAANKGLGVVVMEPLKGGRLAANLPAEMKAVFDGRPEGWSPAEWALRYVWNDPGVSLLLSGMNSEAQLEENLHVAETVAPRELTDDQLRVYGVACDALRSRIKADCTACRYCQPCPQGVEIPELLAALNAASMWNTKDPWLTGYTRTAGKPDLCIECGKCEEMCPQGLPIRELLKETARTFAA
ncbi:MAG TPA: aldo/keto reductase [Spirochaetia bacterium]